MQQGQTEIGVGSAGLRLYGQGALQRAEDAGLHAQSATGDSAPGGHRRPQSGRRPGCRAALRLRRRVHRLARSGRQPARPGVRQQRAERSARRTDDRRRPDGQARPVRKTARTRRRRGAPHAGGGRADRRQTHGRVQLPLRARDPTRLQPDPQRVARHDLSLPRALPAGLAGQSRVADHLAAAAGGSGQRRARRPGIARDRPGPLSGRRAVVGHGRDADFIDERPLAGGGGAAKVEVDDAFASVVTFASGAMGTLEASRVATGGAITWSSRSTARSARCASTWSG